jgi:hypothetical protein
MAAQCASLEELQQNWPQLVLRALKYKLLKCFCDATLSETLHEYVCAVCGESKSTEYLHPNLLSINTIDYSLLNAGQIGMMPDPFIMHSTL